MTPDLAMWLLAALSLAGTILNVYKRREGFLLWIVANIGWVVVNFSKDIPAQAFLFIVYVATSAWGFVSWGKENPSRNTSRPKQGLWKAIPGMNRVLSRRTDQLAAGENARV